MNCFFRLGLLLPFAACASGLMLGQRAAPANEPTKTPCMESLSDQVSIYTAGKPFLATWRRATIWTRSDGTDSTEELFLFKMARDSSGKKLYEEQSLSREVTGRVPDLSISLDDPLSGTTLTWSDQDKVAWVIHGNSIHSPAMQDLFRKWPWVRKNWTATLCAAGSFDDFEKGESFSIRNLGSRRILGIDAEGTLGTRNDGSVTEERWYSSDLRIPLIIRVTETGVGTAVLEIKSMERVEPDPGLFRVPAGYTIQDWPMPSGRDR